MRGRVAGRDTLRVRRRVLMREAVRVRRRVRVRDAVRMHAVRGRDVYCLLRDGVADSLLGKKFIDLKLKTPATARNWRTVNKILTL